MKSWLSRVLLLAAALIALATVGVAAYREWARPTYLRVAVGPPNGADVKLMSAFNRLLETTHADVRLEIVPTATAHESVVALGKGDVDMAVVRLDDPLPPSAGLVALLRTNLLVVVAPARLKLEGLGDVRRRRIGLVERSPLDQQGLRKVLDAFGIGPEDAPITTIAAGDVAGLTRSGKIDVVAVAGAPAEPEVQAVVNAVAGDRKTPPAILGVPLGDIASSAAAAIAETIDKNAFPRLGIPDDDVETIGVKTALVANEIVTPSLRKRLNDNAVKDVVQSLVERRGDLQREAPLASLIAAPDKDEDSRFPFHPGAAAYVDDVDTSWTSLFSDQLWNMVLVAGALSSATAFVAGFLAKGRSHPTAKILDRLRAIAETAEASDDPDDAEALAQELRKVAFDLAELERRRGSGYAEVAPLLLALEGAREAVAATARVASGFRDWWRRRRRGRKRRDHEFSIRTPLP